MKQILFCFALLFILLTAENVFAVMTIYMKDGGEMQVHKIVFHERTRAELYLVNGRVVTIPVEKIDLPASGILQPVGTYGEMRIGKRDTGPGTFRKVVPQALPQNRFQQEQLQKEWEDARKSAVAIQPYRSIKTGDIVKVIQEPSAQPAAAPPPRTTYSWQRQIEPKASEAVYIVVYKNPDGTYGRDFVAAATFATHFKFQETKVELPKSILENAKQQKKEETAAADTEPEAETEATPPPEITEPSVPEETTSMVAKEDSPVKTEPARRPGKRIIGVILFGTVGAIFAVLLWIVFKDRSKPFLNTSRFRQYEEELRDFEIEIWLKNGKTVEQLREICLKKFYQENPVALSIAVKMLKGIQKNWIIPYITKQAGKTPEEAEQLYKDFQSRLRIIDNLIQSVSERTGLVPQASPVSGPITQKIDESPKTVLPTTPVPRPVTPSSNPVIARPSVKETPIAAVSVLPSPPGAKAEPKSQLRKPAKSAPIAPDLPAYTQNLLKQLGLLSDQKKGS